MVAKISVLLLWKGGFWQVHETETEMETFPPDKIEVEFNSKPIPFSRCGKAAVNKNERHIFIQAD